MLPGAGTDQHHIRYAGVAESSGGSVDTVTAFNVAHYSFDFSGINFAAGSVHFIGTSNFSGGGTQAAAHLIDVSGSNATLQIDVNADGFINGSDIEVHLNMLNGTLTDANFYLI